MNIEQLKKICESAITHRRNWIYNSFGDESGCVIAGMSDITGFVPKDTGEFIATFNPALVSKLLAVVEAAERILAAHESGNNGAVMGEAILSKHHEIILHTALDALENEE